MMRIISAILVLSVVFSQSITAFAGSETWTGGYATNGNWSQSANWGNNSAPGSTALTNSSDVATFSSAYGNTWGNAIGNPVVIDSATQNIGGITFSGAAASYNIGTAVGNSLYVSSGGAIQIAGNLALNTTETINAPLVIEGASSGAYRITNNAASGDGLLDIVGGITGVATSGNSTTLTLNGSNTNGNSVAGTITNGTAGGNLAITKSGAGTWILGGLNTYTGPTMVLGGTLSAFAPTTGNNGAFGYNSAVTLANTAGVAINLNNYNNTIGSLNGGGTTGGNVLLGSGTLTTGALNTADNFAGSISGTGGFTKVGTGTQTLSGANTYTGATNVNSGVLQLGSSGALGSVGSYTSGVTVSNGAALDLNGFSVTANNNSLDLILNGTKSASVGALTNSGAGTTLGGTVTLNTDASIGGNGSFTLSGTISGAGLTKVGSGTLYLTGSNTYTTTTINAGTLSIGIGGPTGSLGTGLVTDNGNLTIARNIDYTIGSANAISGSGSLTQAGTATTTLSGTNTYTGATNVTAGTLKIASAGALGDGTNNSSGVTVSSGASLDLNGTTLTDQSLALNISGTGVNNNGALTNSGGSVIYGGAVTLQSASDIGGTGDITLSGGINGAYGLTKVGVDTLRLTSNTNATTSTTISGGTLLVGNGGTTGSLGSGAVIDNATLAYGRTGNATLSNNISGTGVLALVGGGTYTLSGANTYTGATNVLFGTLKLGSVGALGDGTNNTSGVTLNGGQGFLDLNGISPTANVSLYLSAGSTDNGDLTNTSATAATYGGVVNLGTNSFSNIGSNFGDISLTSGVAGTNVFELVKVGSNTLKLLGNSSYTGNTVISAGTLQIGNGGTTGSLGTGNVSNNGSLVFDLSSNSTVSNNISGLGSLTQAGSGTTTLSGANTYTGATNVFAGTLKLGSVGALGNGTNHTSGVTVSSGASLDLYGFSPTANVPLTISGTGVAGAGALINGNSQPAVTYGGPVTIASGGAKIGGVNEIILTGELVGSSSSDALTTTNNQLVLASPNTNYAGNIIISSGILVVGNGSTTGGLGSGNVIDNSVLGFYNSTATTVSNNISGTGLLYQAGSGALTLSGSNSSFSGGTTIYPNSTLIVGSSTALGTGGGVINNHGALTIGSNNLNLSNLSSTYIQWSNAVLNLTVNSATSYGSILTHAQSTVDNDSTINVTVAGHVRKGTVLNIINTSGTGIIGGVPTVTTTDPFNTFTPSVLEGNLILTALTGTTGYAASATNSNASAVGSVLDNITNAGSDLSNILNTLSLSTDSKVAAALNTFSVPANRGILDNSAALLNSFTGASMERTQTVLGLASSSMTGVSAGDTDPLNGFWGKQYGSYLDQGTRNGIQGYNAWNEGTVLGVDHLFNDNLTVGVSLGYAYGRVNSDANRSNTNISSAQGTLYGGYQGTNIPYYLDLAGSVAQNWYNGSRNITVDTIHRIANSQYQGTQTGIYVESGYKYDLGNNFLVTPLTSLQWTHLNIRSYTETNAGDLNLKVNGQGYNTLESGLGASIAYPVKYRWGSFTPEFHAKWLYDFINDNIAVTSSFAGGGASFSTNGTAQARNGANVGGKLTFDLRNDVSLIAQVDTELRDRYVGAAGSVSVRIKF